MYWDPVNGHFSALPFIYGTLVSSFLALLIAVPLAVGLAIFLTEMCPGALRGPLAFLTELLAAIPSVIYGLWAVFVLVPLLREHVNPVLIKLPGLDGLLQRRQSHRTGLSGRRRDSGHHDSAHHLFADARGDDGGAALAARSGAGAGRHALGDDPHGRAAQCAHRHCGRGHSGAGPRAGRDHGGDHGHRQHAGDSPLAAFEWSLDGRGDCQRVRRSGQRHASAAR